MTQVDGQSHFVVGARIDDQGHTHAQDGLCNAVRKARVAGEVRDARFMTDEFELLP